MPLISHKGRDGLFFGDPLTYALVGLDDIADFEGNMRRYGSGDGSASFGVARDPPLIIKHREPTDPGKSPHAKNASCG